MRAYIVRRLLLMIPTFIGISVITFFIIQLSPGNPVMLKLRASEVGMRADAAATQETLEQTKKLYGLDKPIYVQYALWLYRLVRLDFGQSFKDQRPVIEKIAEALPVTLQLELASLLVVYAVSIPLGVYSATHARTRRDYLITVGLFLLYSVPSFWMAMMLIMFFGGGEYLNWFPIDGLSSIMAEEYPWGRWLLDRLWHMVLPVFCLSDLTVHAHRNAGSIEPGLHSHGAGLRFSGTYGRLEICHAQLAHSHRDVAGLFVTFAHRWKHFDRNHLFHSGLGSTYLRSGVIPGLSAHYGYCDDFGVADPAWGSA
jgi:ABC-type microcin C transport system permease subunit YejB